MAKEWAQYTALEGLPPAELLVRVGEWLESNGEPHLADAYYDAALSVDPTFSLAAFRSGKLMYRLGNYPEAIKKLRRAVSLTPDHAPTCYHLALAFERSQRHRGAIYWAKQTLRHNPQHDGAFLVLLRNYAALKWWRAVLKISQNMPQRLHQAGEVHLWQALAHAQLGQMSLARVKWALVPLRVRKRYREDASQVAHLLTSCVIEDETGA